MIAFGLVLLALCALANAQQQQQQQQILLYTKTAGFRHDSIPTGIRTITALGDGSLTLPSSAIEPSISNVRWSTVNSEDETQFHNYTFLAQFDAIGFLSTTDVDPPGVGTVLDDQGLRNLARYVQQGGNYFGIHSAAATLFGAPFYGRLVGAFFDYHPQIQNVTVRATDASHPSTSRWPQDGFTIYEEMYNFRSDPRQLPSPANILVSNASAYQDGGVNPQGFRNGTNGPAPHPLAWWRQGALLDTNAATDPSVRGGGGADIQVSGGPGRSWFTSLGHDNSTWAQDLFRGHVAGGIAWVLASSTSTANTSTTTSTTTSTSSPPAATSGTAPSGAATANRLGAQALLLPAISAIAVSIYLTLAPTAATM
ncbi:hypothetical protein L1887_42075 [Cichorium endivia]|nr:hypothetical protein L1887_42075 [Cichorium endivia]